MDHFQVVSTATADLADMDLFGADSQFPECLQCDGMTAQQGIYDLQFKQVLADILEWDVFPIQ